MPEQLPVFFDARLAVRGLGIASAYERLSGELGRVHGLDVTFNVSSSGWTRRGKVQTLARSGLLDLSPALDPRIRARSVVHYFGNTAPRRPTRATVITVHDLMMLRSSSRKAKLYEQLLVPGLRATTGPIVAISSMTADAIRAELPQQADRVVTIPHGKRPSTLTNEPRTHVFMFGGSSDPRKRVSLGLAAYAAYAAKAREPLPLVIAGRARVDLEEVHRLVPAHLLRYHANPDGPEVERLLREAACLLYPTAEEGYGLPLVEAGEVGTPVVYDPSARIPQEPLGLHTVPAKPDPDDWATAIMQAIRSGPVPDALPDVPLWSEVAESYAALYRDVWRRL